MLRIMMELLGTGLMYLGKRGARKQAFNALMKSGALSKGTKFGSTRATNMLRALEKGDDMAERVISSVSRRAAKRVGIRYPGMLGNLPGNANAIRAGVGSAQKYLQHSRYYGAAFSAMTIAPSIGFGFQMIGGIGDLNEKVMNPAAIEQMQTQQMFLPRQAYTQRQRAIQAIHQSQMTTRSAMGNEAQYMHG